jgi:hypothetical protein
LKCENVWIRNLTITKSFLKNFSWIRLLFVIVAVGPGAFHFEKRQLCAECYQEFGSCCPEFGKNELWTPPADE